MIDHFKIKIPSGIFLVLICYSFFSCKNETNEIEHRYTNRLIDETSPYLLQHAHNPVDWIPWDNDSFKEAKQNNKLVLISVGYSSCHWCHVMEKETFEDDSIAKFMNKHFVNIKVDREEHPDVDQVYMTALQLMTGNGGWPLNVIALPDGKPVYAGTYHTKTQWDDVLRKIIRLYREDPDKFQEYANKVTSGIQTMNMITPEKEHPAITKDLLKKSIDNWKEYWDLTWGGEINDQKFVIPHRFNVLLDYATLEGDKEILNYVENTLDKIALGGIYDHVGGGFYRYSTDKEWKVPHFEKMLYTNAQLVSLYSKAYKVFKKPLYKEVVFGTIDFLKKEMKNSEGAYYAAIDADSEGEEGKYYLWEEEELKKILKTDYKLFSTYFNTTKNEILESNNYLLYRSVNDSLFAKQLQITISDLNLKKKKWKTLLQNVRKNRVRPIIDDKIITSWNAILMKGFADAYASFGVTEFLNEAIGVSEFIQKYSKQKEHLRHSYKKGSTVTEGFLEDYAFLTEAYIKLFEVTMDTKYLDMAIGLNKDIHMSFKDASSDMFVYRKGNQLISNIVKTNDGVLPSSNSVIAHNLFRLGLLYDIKEFSEKSKRMLSLMLPQIEDDAGSYASWNTLLLQNVFPFYEVAIVGKDADTLVAEFNNEYIPNLLIAGSSKQSGIPLFKNRYIDNETYIYVCQQGMCKLPIKEAKEAIDLLKKNFKMPIKKQVFTFE